jgi:hypothetical protein
MLLYTALETIDEQVREIHRDAPNLRKLGLDAGTDDFFFKRPGREELAEARMGSEQTAG